MEQLSFNALNLRMNLLNENKEISYTTPELLRKHIEPL